MGSALLLGGCAKSADYGSMAPEASYSQDESIAAEFGYDPLQSSAMGGSVAPNAPAGGAGDFDDAEYRADGANVPAERVAVVETMAMADSTGGVFARAADKRRERKVSKKMKNAAPAAAPTEVAEEQAKQEPLDQPKDPKAAVASGEDKQDEPDDHGRQIIYTAAMIVAVHDVTDATERAEKIPEAFGGYVHQRSEGTLVLKIPAKNLRKAMDALAAYGIVQARQLQAQDVTAEYTDLESRIRVLQNTQAQLLELLKKAQTVEETLRVRQALDQVTMQLETALGRMRQLSDAISFSTLTIRFQQRSPQHHLPSSNDPFRWVDQLGVESTEWR